MKDIFKIKNFVFQRNIKIDYFLKIILKGIKNKLYRIYFLKNLSLIQKNLIYNYYSCLIPFSAIPGDM